MKTHRVSGLITLVTGVSLFGLFLFAPAPSVSAQTSNTNAAQGIEISPALVELNGAAGGSYLINLTITNVTPSDLFYTVSVDDFTAKDETGAPQILLDTTLPESASIRSWVSSPTGFTLASRESRTVPVQVVIPADAEPGGHYGVVRFSGQAPEVKDTGVGLSASAGTLLLVRVDGDITEQARLANFFTAYGDGTQSFFFETSPIGFVARIENAGNIHIKPVGSIEIKDMFGSIVTTIPVNDEKSNVLPDSTRRFDIQYDGGFMIGHYTANLTLGYGTTGQALTNTISFWVIPYRMILAIVFTTATVGYILYRLVKVYNKRIIAKATQTHDKKTTKPPKKAKKK